MTATYDENLSTDKDWVRRLTGDTDTSSAELSDEEITAILAEQTATGDAKKYYAAAACRSMLLTKYASTGAGLQQKTVEKLALKWGVDSSSLKALQDSIQELRREGARRLQPAPFVFRAG